MSILKRLFGSGKQAELAPYEGSPPQPEVGVFTIGDVHGCADLLTTLLDRIDTVADPKDVIVTVGDYIDRGDMSRSVLEALMERSTANPERFICLMGNHEKMLLDFLDRPAERGSRWIRNGGLQTLADFGVGGVTTSLSGQEVLDVRQDFASRIPEELVDWVRNRPLHWSSGTLSVVHAAADPHLSLSEQDDRTLLWGHRDFLTIPRRDDVWVAHGHTVMDQAIAAESRISVDTGAYFSGVLTAAHIKTDGGVTFIQT